MSASNQRVVKNTIVLYIRMIIVVMITLYTSRIVLDEVGATDFGIYTVTAGFIAMLGFVQGAMVSATQRYYSFDIGQNNGSNLTGILSTSVNIHLIMTIIVVAIAETFGLLFVSTSLNIPADRFESAMITFQLALVSFCITIMYTPFAAMLIAQEKIGVYAGIGIADVMIKLMLIVSLSYVDYDKLVAYSFFVVVSNLLVLFVYLACWKIYFKNVTYILKQCSGLRSMLSFTSWNLFGNLASVLSNQGTNILLNIFFGPIVNASKGISMQVGTALNNFSGSLLAVLNPQIVKSFASGDSKRMHDLVIYGAKYNFFLVLIISYPLLINLHYLLQVWLIDVPGYTLVFCELVVINLIIDSASGTLMTSAQASGRIKLYQTAVGGTLLLNIPLSYLFLSLDYPPYIVSLISVLLSFLAIFVRLYINAPLVGLLPLIFFHKVIFRMIVLITACSLANFTIFSRKASNFSDFLFTSTMGLLFCIVCVFFLGLEFAERKFVVNFTKRCLKGF